MFRISDEPITNYAMPSASCYSCVCSNIAYKKAIAGVAEKVDADLSGIIGRGDGLLAIPEIADYSR
jgi:hypothetical protein